MLMRDTPLSFSSPLPEPMAGCVKVLQNREKPLRERIAELLPSVFGHGYTYFYFGLLSMYTAIMAEASERFAETV